MTRTIVPISNLPQLPLSINIENLNFTKVVWYNYFKMVKEFSKSESCNLWDAHLALQKKYPFKKPEIKDKEFWNCDSFIILFMLQFKEWQHEKYDLDEVDKKFRNNMFDQQKINDEMTLSEIFESFSDEQRSDFVNILWCYERDNDNIKYLNQIVEDPIYGYSAQNEIISINNSKEFFIEEQKRISLLNDNIKIINELIKKGFPTSYSVHFPFPINNYHNIQNCLCVLGDGFPIFRLEVLDPQNCTQFKLVELMKPWFSINGVKEYDFPFYDFKISENDIFDLNKFIEVINFGIQRISSRHERKYHG